MNIENVFAVVVSFVLGIGAIAPYIAKIRKGLRYAKEILDVPEAAADIIEAVEKSMEDGNLSEAEVRQIVELAKELKTQVEQVKELF